MRITLRQTDTLYEYDVLLDGHIAFEGLRATGAVAALAVARRAWCRALSTHVHAVPRWLQLLHDHNVAYAAADADNAARQEP